MLPQSSLTEFNAAVQVPAPVIAPKSKTGLSLSVFNPKIHVKRCGITVKAIPASRISGPACFRAARARGPAVRPTQAINRFNPRSVNIH